MWHSAGFVGGWGLFHICTLSLPHQAWLSLHSISIWPCVGLKSCIFLSLGPLWSLTSCVCVCVSMYVWLFIFWPLPSFTYLQPKSAGASQVALVVKNPSANVGDVRGAGSISGWGRSPGGGHGHSLQYSCLENSMDRGAWWTIVYSITKNQTLLSD